MSTGLNVPLGAREVSQCRPDFTFTYDADIAGVGVRLSFYLQNFILVWLVARSPTDSEGALWTFIATSFGLTIAALVQVGGGKLTLLEGILVTQLSWLANLGTILALASYSRLKGKDNLVKVAAVVQGYLSMVLTIVMWRYAPKFPSSKFETDNPCNEILTFVFMFGIRVRALTTGRMVALVFSSLMLAANSLVTFTECRAWLATQRQRGTTAMPSSPQVDRSPSPSPNAVESGGVQRLRGGSHQHRDRLQNRYAVRSKKIWLGFEADPIIFGILIAQIVLFTYFIITTEMIVKQPKVQDINTWGFGQVLALTVVIPAAISLITALRKYGFRKIFTEKRVNRRHKHRGGRGHRKNQTSNSTIELQSPARVHASGRQHLEPPRFSSPGASGASSSASVSSITN